MSLGHKWTSEKFKSQRIKSFHCKFRAEGGWMYVLVGVKWEGGGGEKIQISLPGLLTRPVHPNY